jgi:hypothetical protein
LKVFGHQGKEMESLIKEKMMLGFLLFTAIFCQAKETESLFAAIVSKCPDTSICLKYPLGDSGASFYLIVYDTSTGYLFRTIHNGFIQNGDSIVDMCSNEPEYWVSKSPINKRKNKLYIEGISEVHSMSGGKKYPAFKDTLTLNRKWVVDKFRIKYWKENSEKFRSKWCASKD